MTKNSASLKLIGVGVTIFAAASLVGLSACQPNGDRVSVDDDDIGGVVSGPDGPEAGVWVIAETTDLPTRLNKIVVTDDDGRYLIPDLPSATYDVWVRGYGLVDSGKVRVTPGTVQDLDRGDGTRSACGGRVLSGRVLVLATPGAGPGRVPGHGARGKRDLAKHGQPGRMAQVPEVRRLHGVSSTGQQADARDSRGAR